MSGRRFVSPRTRFGAYEWNATKRPSALITGSLLPLFVRSLAAWRPELETSTRSVRPLRRSRTKTSAVRFVSRGTRLVAEDSNATKRPFALRAGSVLSQPDWLQRAWAPRLVTLART